MDLDIKKLREMRKSSANVFGNIVKALEKTNKSNNNDSKDDRFWSMEADEAGNATATIRFLPAIKEDDLPWVKLYSHGFKNPETNRWYIENCRSTIGLEDPVNELNNQLWATKLEHNVAQARLQKRKLAHISNIIVINDPKNPDNNGKVFLFKYGQKIFEKLYECMNPTFDTETPFDVFSPWEGANVRLKMCRKDGFANFDKTTIDSPSEISDDDEKLLEILNQRHDLNEFLNESNFKSYEVLQKRLNYVLGKDQENGRDSGEDKPKLKSKSEDYEPEKSKKVESPKTVKEDKPLLEDDEDDMADFMKLIES
jgi:hypothetical protein